MAYSYNTRVLTFEDAEALLRYQSKKGERPSRKVANNTYLIRRDEDSIGVVLHFTTVVLIHRDGTYTLNSGGYRTHTTKDRLNTFSPAQVFQSQYRWYVGRCTCGGAHEYFDGIKVDHVGLPLS